MGFFDEYKDIGGNYIDAEEKGILIEGGVPVTVLAIAEETHTQYGDRYAVQILVPEGVEGVQAGERTITFPRDSVESRDRMLGQMMEYLDREDADDVEVKLEKNGRSILLRAA